ncbi:MAG TPA: hypothetical protein VF713_19120 [Thermoanaerobaculia bacterium]
MPIPPPPTFWPTKATEWVALIGGVLGTFAFTLSLFNYRRDRARLHFAAYDDSDDQWVKRKTIYLAVSNIGRRPIRIVLPWIYWRDGSNWPMRETEPIVLAEQGHITFELTQDRLVDEVLAFSVRDSAGKDHWHYPRFRPFGRLRLSIRHWRGQSP